MGRNRSSPASVVFGWLRRLSIKVKTFLGVIVALFALVGLKLFVENHNHFFVASEAAHASGILVLIYKLTTQKTCSGLSLKSQELTALFLAVRLSLGAIMEFDIHVGLDLAALISTLWVIYTIRYKLKATYIKELDKTPLYLVVAPAAVLALLVHPRVSQTLIFRVLWAFAVYLESVSVLPQLRMMQNAKMIEPMTAHYVFALGVARFFACAHWIILVYDTKGSYFFMYGSGFLWFPVALLAEIVQTFILADFCYYYIKRFIQGQLLMRMPV